MSEKIGDVLYYESADDTSAWICSGINKNETHKSNIIIIWDIKIYNRFNKAIFNMSSLYLYKSAEIIKTSINIE